MSSTKQTPTNNVLSLHSGGRQSSPQLSRIERYWNEVRGRRLVPSRCEIDPCGLEGVLSHTFVLERIVGGLAKFRIAGSHLNELMGIELRQMPVSALFLPPSRHVLSDIMLSVFDEPTSVRMTLQSPSGYGRERLEGEMLLLPLRSDLGDIDRILGGLVLNGRIGRTPRRIDIVSQTRTSLVGFAGQTQSPQNFNIRADRPNALAPPEPRAAKKRPVSETKHLRLIVSND